ncbi:histidine phosphatase family protein [Leptolyngbya sp. FACHB-671]|uniref:histidine phosphatase family protein n=1 Tax=Leptolyngbya sp. FACHB-671 TaxID=2692812 RepID=UPI00168846FB|nr:histidine phosphatase family protein [Leptolyngbya sp. FACHB-671]MBD2068289.1 histidine phosphatase family protein [Leptolyngbya sp. FACHB-671]
MSQTVWIARHGNRQDFVDSSWHRTAERPFDPGLSADGILQAKELGKRLQGEKIVHIFASPFLRTIETAHYVAEALDLSIKVESGLSEFLNPNWFFSTPECLTIDSLSQLFPRVDRSYISRVIAEFPETEQTALRRAGKVARHLATEFPQNLLLVGHGASVLGATRGLLEDPVHVSCPLCGLFKLVKQGDEWLMELSGDVSHLSRTEQNIRYI